MMSHLTSLFAMAQEGTATAAPSLPPDAEEHFGSYLLPEQASNLSTGWDWLFYALLGLSCLFFFAIVAFVVYFSWKYRARPGHTAQPSPSHNNTLEITWTVIPSILVVIIFVLGWRGYMDMATPPQHSEEVRVIAGDYTWRFQHRLPGGDMVQTANELHVPLGKPVRLVMTSSDFIHSFFVPAFRVKKDVLPGRYTYLWFTATQPGRYRLNCAEYCGVSHSQMLGEVVVHDVGGYEKFLEEEAASAANADPVALGQKTYKFCAGCHSTDGSVRGGPSFKGIFGKTETLKDGSTVTVDENYLRESILNPTAKIVKGFQPIMPPFGGQLKENQIDAMIEFIKTLQ